MRPLNLLLVLCLMLPMSVSLADDDLRPVTHEEVWLMKRIGAPVISPDGRLAVISVTEPAYEDDQAVSDLWLVSLDGSAEPRRLTSTPGGESGAAWSPDGTRLAFSAARVEEEPAQIYLLTMDGPGEAEQLTTLSTGASNPVWSPDGSMIAFESRVYPGAVDDAANQAEQEARDERGIKVSRYEIFPIRQWDRWRDELQTRLFIQSARPGSEAKDLMVESELVASPGYSGVPSLSGDGLHAAWTPDGNALIIRCLWRSPGRRRCAGHDLGKRRGPRRAGPGRSGERRARTALTDFNAERAAGLDRQAFRELLVHVVEGPADPQLAGAAAGLRRETSSIPLVLFIHGGPFSPRWTPTTFAGVRTCWRPPGYVVLLTDYTGSVGYGAEFSRNIEGDPLKTPGEELVEAADIATERFAFIDPDRQAASGASYGGHLVNWLLATTDRFDALVGHAGLVDLEGQYSTSDVIYHRERMNGGPAWGDSPVWEEQSPSSYVGNFSTPTMLTIGEKDFRVPINQTIAAWSYLQRMQVPSRLLVFHDADHWIMNGKEAKHFWQEVHDWLGSAVPDS
jgi:dipeptidyl aminopeptidase/acylaminoacyl peptidase